MTTDFGWYNAIDGHQYGSVGTAMGSTYLAPNGRANWFVENALSGITTVNPGGQGSQLLEGNASCAGETFNPANYSSNVASG